MIRAVLLAALGWALAAAAAAQDAPAERVVGALSQNRVAITANFDGSEIFVFGAVRREAPAPTGAPLEVVVEVRGPSRAVTVRRKERTFGIWANRDTVVIDEAPSFYAIATTGPLDEIMSATERLRHRVGLERAIRTLGARSQVTDVEHFSDAVVRIRTASGLYTTLLDAVDLREETLFSTRITLPANLVEGNYVARMFLLRDREVVHVAQRTILVRKEGLERLIYTTAHERPLLYGVLSIAVALAAGWAASAAFQLIRR